MKDPEFADFGSRLRTARKMAGMSLEDLSGKMGGAVTRQAISKYEKGRMMPSPGVLSRLTQTLPFQPYVEPIEVECYRIAEMAQPDLNPPSSPLLQRGEDMAATAPELAQVRFREREKLPAKTAVALRLRVEDYIKRCLEIESALGIRHPFENPLAGCAIRTVADVEAAATDVRRAWDLGSGPVANLLGLLEEKGIRVFELRGIEGFEGLSGNYGTVPFVTVNRDVPDDRLRFTAAHELGHLLCGFPEREGAESLCHAFAGAFLLPREAAEKALMPARRKISLWEFKELKEGYGISLQAIIYRARSLGLVTGRQVRRFRETIREKGWLVTEPVEYRGNEQASRLRRLLSYAVVERIIAPERAAALAGVSEGEFMRELGHIF
jgi:Zn-dependent peptidase ImmA (M78 family)/transcriptional regulator with XRE-family HTH domain